MIKDHKPDQNLYVRMYQELNQSLQETCKHQNKALICDMSSKACSGLYSLIVMKKQSLLLVSYIT